MSRSKPLLLTLGVALAILVFLGWYATRPDRAHLSVGAVSGTKPNITAARGETVPTVGIASVVGWAGEAKPVAAPGLNVAAFAKDLDHPRWLYELPNGDVLVAETNSPPRPIHGIKDWIANKLFRFAGAAGDSPDRITLLRDTNGDGVADFRSVFLSHLTSPFGMALIKDKLYVGDTDALVWFPYKTGETHITAPATKVMTLAGGGNHWARNIIASPDGSRIYVAVGSSTNIADDGIAAEKYRANILEYAPVNDGWRVYSSGLRNPVGMAYGPKGHLWTVVNERDQLGSDLPPDYMALVDFGAFYGWPYSYWGGYEDRRLEDKHPETYEYTRRPDYALGPHTASLGLAWGSLGAFHNGMFVGQHGSWNRQPPSGYKVVFVGFNDGGFPSAPMRDVLTGFLDKDGNAQGRPVGVIARKGGDLLVADDVGNRVWRVSAVK